MGFAELSQRNPDFNVNLYQIVLERCPVIVATLQELHEDLQKLLLISNPAIRDCCPLGNSKNQVK